MGTKPATTLAKGLHLLTAVVADDGRSSLSALAASIGVPLSTAHRLALTLVAEGFLECDRKGHYLAGPALDAVAGTGRSAKRIAARLRGPLARLARAQQGFAHFGVLEDGMVTYLVKQNGHSSELFTAEQAQLEAYCSALGKVLLAALPDRELDAYLAGGPFVALTDRTLTTPDTLRHEIATVRHEGVAYDRCEIRDDLFCIGVPVRDPAGTVVGAASVSLVGLPPDRARISQLGRQLAAIAAKARVPHGPRHHPIPSEQHRGGEERRHL
jgi:IclR family acetate operon transcriptional repressor